MAISHKTTIAFSLVSVPVSLYTATQDNDISFNQLHEADGQRIRYKKVCGHCNQEVKSEDIIKGYEYAEDKYVTITDEDLEKIKTEKDKSIQILHFATLNQISPTYFDKTYYAVPEAGGEKAFELLRSALLEEQKIAIGKTVMRDKENLIAIIPRDDGILIQTMLFQDDIKELPKSYEKPSISQEELQMAKTLVNSMNTPFEPNIYKDEYQEKLKNLIETKIQGKEVQNQEENQTTIINLMEALKQSIEKERVNV